MAGADTRPTADSALAAFSVPATVNRPDEDPIATRGMWLPEVTDPQPFGRELTRSGPRKIFAVPRSDVDQAPKGTVISAPEVSGGTVKTWQVDGLERPVEVDMLRLVVSRTADPQ